MCIFKTVLATTNLDEILYQVEDMLPTADRIKMKTLRAMLQTDNVNKIHELANQHLASVA